MRVDHKLLLRLFLIDFCLFYSQFGKSIEISFNLSAKNEVMSIVRFAQSLNFEDIKKSV